MTVEDLIRSFRITAKYKGYFMMMDAVEYAINHFGRFIRITKDLYPILAKEHHVNNSAVERNIRTIVIACWHNNKELLEEIMGCKLVTYPTNSEFIYSAAYYIIKDKIKK